MSHTTTVKSVAIRDEAAIRQTVDQLRKEGIDVELVTNQRPRMYYAQQHKECEYVLKLGGCPYDVGLEKQSDGTFAPVFDDWAGHVSNKVGAACPLPGTPEGKAQHAIGQFLQTYAKNAAVNAAVSQGYMVENSYIDDKGNVQLVINV